MTLCDQTSTKHKSFSKLPTVDNVSCPMSQRATHSVYHALEHTQVGYCMHGLARHCLVFVTHAESVCVATFPCLHSKCIIQYTCVGM